MANTIGANLKNAALDVTRQLQRAGEAIINPGKLGSEALGAFKTLRVLDNLATLLPPNMQPLVKALLGVGIQNVGQHGDPTAKSAARGYASAMAIKSGRVPGEVLQKATSPEQRQALTDAAASGDLATVKSILRHNKKQAAAPSEPMRKPDVSNNAVSSLETRATQIEEDEKQQRTQRDGARTMKTKGR